MNQIIPYDTEKIKCGKKGGKKGDALFFPILFFPTRHFGVTG